MGTDVLRENRGMPSRNAPGWILPGNDGLWKRSKFALETIPGSLKSAQVLHADTGEGNRNYGKI